MMKVETHYYYSSSCGEGGEGDVPEWQCDSMGMGPITEGFHNMALLHNIQQDTSHTYKKKKTDSNTTPTNYSKVAWAV